MSRYLLSIGSNCPCGREMMAKAIEWLHANFTDVNTSGIYRTQALNGRSADYLNMVARASSPQTPGDVAAMAKEFERQCGRSPLSKSSGCVEMDVDVIAADSTVLRPDEFTRAYFIRGFEMLGADSV